MKIHAPACLWLVCGLSTLALVVAVTIRVYQRNRIRPSPHTITFEQASFDFGTVLQNEKVRHDFRLLNNTSNKVLITGLRTTCSCTVTESNLVGLWIQPHAHINIPVTFDTGDRDGVASSELLVSVTDNGSQYELQAAMRGIVLAEFTITPAFVDFGSITPGAVVTRTVAFRPKALASIEVTAPSSTNSTFSVSISRQTNIAEALISFHAPLIHRRQTLSSLLLFPTSSVRMPTARLYVRGEVVPDIEVIPDLLVFSSEDSRKDVAFAIESTNPARIVGVIGTSTNNSQFPLSHHVDSASTNMFSLQHSITVADLPGSQMQCLQFELEVQNATSHKETRFVTVSVKCL